MNEIKKKAQTPISKQPKPKHTFINNPLKKTNLRITTANINSNYDDVVDSLDTAEETNEKINQLYAHPVKQNNLDELNKRVYFTPTHSREYVNNKSFNPSFIGNSNMNINLSTGISTNESNESFDSGTFQKYREERGMRTSTYSNSAHKKINFNLALGCTMGNSMYPPMMQQYYPVNPCNLNYNFMRPENYENLNNIHNLPENAFTYSYMNKFNSEKKKKKNSKEEIDQNVFVINIENIVYGKDLRTTVMIRHIPNKYSSSCLLEEINLKFKGKYDFFYLPMDFEVIITLT